MLTKKSRPRATIEIALSYRTFKRTEQVLEETQLATSGGIWSMACQEASPEAFLHVNELLPLLDTDQVNIAKVVWANGDVVAKAMP